VGRFFETRCSRIQMMLALASRHEDSNALPSIVHIVGEERMTPGHSTSVLLLWVSFSALTLLVGWREGHPVYKNPCYLSKRQGCKQDLGLQDRDETETFGFWFDTRPRPRPSCNSMRPRRDQDVWFLPRGETETETLQVRDRDVFETFNRQHCAKTMNGNVQIKTIYIKQYRSHTVSCTCIAINK